MRALKMRIEPMGRTRERADSKLSSAHDQVHAGERLEHVADARQALDRVQVELRQVLADGLRVRRCGRRATPARVA
jgi:hypothetical protein